ncbi:hypothetical protein C5E07_05340 [Pseudoclavibacter sp. RFBJ3]|nr:hypothetical protein C5C12_06045 [Pseudoclavibacter sp. RFBJ5]PPF93926.1 hypothetical protein C5E07_05340 [Pseudoclavibacter sp. RFBJ3]PPF98643.1 hypothetical protein C5C19_08325 [Pseudoclavibacter sp. RFBH5]PPG24396.1 hypothetical protein C5E13_06545 [Pseudoclavibacter sp. RFBI4]
MVLFDWMEDKEAKMADPNLSVYSAESGPLGCLFTTPNRTDINSRASVYSSSVTHSLEVPTE